MGLRRERTGISEGCNLCGYIYRQNPKEKTHTCWDETTSCSYFRGTGAFLPHHQLLKSCGHQTTPSQPLPISSLNTCPKQWAPVGRHSSSRVGLGEQQQSTLGLSPRIQFPLCQGPWMCSKLLHHSGPSGPQVVHLGCTWTWYLSEQAVNRRQHLRVTWSLSLCIRLVQSSGGKGWRGELSPLGDFFSRPKASKMSKHVIPRKASARLLKAFLLQVDFIGMYVCVCLYVWEGWREESSIGK